MDNESLEMMTYECQVGMYFSGIEKLSNGFVVYSKIVEDEQWNFFTGFSAETIEDFENAYNDAKLFFKKIKREPCFLISPKVKISKTVEDYLNKKYDNFSIDVTMLTEEFKFINEIQEQYSFRRIDNKLEKDLFVQTFKSSKTQVVDGDTYGALPEFYFKALDESFKSKSSWQYIHFLSMFNDFPVGMVSAVVKGEYCGLYGGGTYVLHRGKGVFRNLLKFIEKELKMKGVKYFFGITEKDSKNEKLYNYLGLESRFIKKYYK